MILKKLERIVDFLFYLLVVYLVHLAVLILFQLLPLEHAKQLNLNNRN
jgi:hypothetical protein